MQTVAIEVQDSFMQQFLNFVNSHSGEVVIAKDPNLELDQYFYERQQELQEIRQSTQTELVSFEDFEDRVCKLETTLELKYAD